MTSCVTLRFSVATPKNHNKPHREVEVNEITPDRHRQLTGKELHAPWTHIAAHLTFTKSRLQDTLQPMKISSSVYLTSDCIVQHVKSFSSGFFSWNSSRGGNESFQFLWGNRLGVIRKSLTRITASQRNDLSNWSNFLYFLYFKE